MTAFCWPGFDEVGSNPTVRPSACSFNRLSAVCLFVGESVVCFFRRICFFSVSFRFLTFELQMSYGSVMVLQGFDMLLVYFRRWFWFQFGIVFYTLQLAIFAVMLLFLLL